MKILSSNLSILSYLLLFCLHANATEFEIKLPNEPHLVDDTVIIQVFASDLPPAITSLQGSISWTKNSLTLMEVKSAVLPFMIFNTEATDTLGFNWFGGQAFLGSEQNIIQVTFHISPANASDTVLFNLGNVPTRLEIVDNAFNTIIPQVTGAAMPITENLPVGLSDFKATPRDNTIYLDWRTESEINFDGFEVQRAVDGNNFTALQWLDARGNDMEGVTYGYSDESLTFGKTYYYRLKMQDLDGTYKHSNVISTRIKGQGPVVEVYPNPAFGETTIAFEHFLSESVPTAISVYDNMGRKLQHIQHRTTVGNNKIILHLNDLHSGIYTLTLEQGEYHTIQKLVVW